MALAGTGTSVAQSLSRCPVRGHGPKRWAGRRRARAERCHAVPRMPQLPFGTQMCYNKGHLAPPHRNGELLQLQLCVVPRPIGGAGARR